MSVCVTEDDDVQTAEACRGLIDRALDRGLVANVDH
jgi:hypothetical protein